MPSSRQFLVSEFRTLVYSFLSGFQLGHLSYLVQQDFGYLDLISLSHNRKADTLQPNHPFHAETKRSPLHRGQLFNFQTILFSKPPYLRKQYHLPIRL